MPQARVRPAEMRLSPLRDGREQAKSTGPVDGLQAAVGAELVVQVSHMRPDRVHRHIKLAGDLRRGKAGLQEAQDAGLGLADRVGQVLGRARGWRRSLWQARGWRRLIGRAHGWGSWRPPAGRPGRARTTRSRRPARSWSSRPMSRSAPDDLRCSRPGRPRRPSATGNRRRSPRPAGSSCRKRPRS